MNPDKQRSFSGPKVAFAYLAGTIIYDIYGIGPIFGVGGSWDDAADDGQTGSGSCNLPSGYVKIAIENGHL